MSIIWSKTESENGASVSIVYSDGTPATVDKSHANFKKILKALVNDATEKEIKDLVNPANKISHKLRRLSDRVTTDGRNILFDGDVVSGVLSGHILKLITLEDTPEAAPWKPFVNFLEKTALILEDDSRDSLFTFIQHHGLTVRNDGDFIAYKGVNNDFSSVRSGPGIVDNVSMNGNLPNKPGSILEVKRSYVDADRNRGCSTGLHAGTMNYARQWGSTVVAVAINPRDVISVPHDSNFQKLRVARYEVISKVSNDEKDSARATVGDKSEPVWTKSQSARKTALVIDVELLKKLKKAVKNRSKVTVIYKTLNGDVREFKIIPVSISGDYLELVLYKEGNARRSFLLSGIQAVKPKKKK